MNKGATKWKLSLTCSNCAKIFNCPIELPCGDLVCQQHLNEKEIVQKNKIKCLNCKKEFDINSNLFKTNKLAKLQIETKIYLNDEELALKQKIEDSIRLFFEMYEDFILKKSKLDLDCLNHFQGLKLQINYHREHLKQKIDEIYMEMIEKIKEYESSYFKNLNLKNETFLKSLEIKSVDEDLINLEESFREPNLLNESMKEMHHKKEKEIESIEFKLHEMNKIIDNLRMSIDFKPYINFGQDLFGQLNLNDLFKSQILNEQQPFELLKLCKFNPNDRFKLLYRASEHGFDSKDFHSKCDGHANTLTIFKASESSFIFGGYTTATWDSSNTFKSDPKAFLFSLTNKDNLSCKMKIKGKRHQYAINCNSSRSLMFGNDDICIKSNSNANKISYSNLGFTYKHPQYAYGTNEAQLFLSGSAHFNLSEIEVYEKEMNHTNEKIQ